MASAGKTFDRVACKYCSAEISTNSLTRHEADCVNASDELREKRKHARELSEERREGTKTKDRKQRTEVCEFCHDHIGAGSIVRHRVKCANQTPEERRYSKSQRQYQNRHYNRQKKSEDNRRRYQASMHVPKLDQPVVPDSYQQHFAGNGTPMKNPMAISMMVDENDFALALGRVVISKLPELLPQLIPGLKIDSFATKHVRGPHRRTREES